MNKQFPFEQVVTVVFIVAIISVPMICAILDNNKLYKSMLIDVQNESWATAKRKLEKLDGYRNSKRYADKIYYGYYFDIAEATYKKGDFCTALGEYKRAQKYNKDDKDIESKINEVDVSCKKFRELKRKKEELARRKAEQKTQRMLDNVVVLQQRFGYTQYGERAVVGKIKNKNSFSVMVRADIDLKDASGNIVDTTYTYDRIAPNSVWNFEAPTFGARASNTYLHLTVEELD